MRELNLSTHNLALLFREILCIAPSETRSRCSVVEFDTHVIGVHLQFRRKNESGIHLQFPHKTSLPLD